MRPVRKIYEVRKRSVRLIVVKKWQYVMKIILIKLLLSVILMIVLIDEAVHHLEFRIAKYGNQFSQNAGLAISEICYMLAKISLYMNCAIIWISSCKHNISLQQRAVQCLERPPILERLKCIQVNFLSVLT